MKQPIHTTITHSDHILSPAVISNGFIFVSGQIPVDENLTLVGETVQEKLKQIMQNIEDILRAANASLDDIVKVVIYVTDTNQMADINEYYPTYFKGDLPVREAVCVAALPLGATIEISVIAEHNVQE